MIMNLQNKKVLVVGTGISGIGAAKLLYKVGAFPVLFDGNENLSVDEVKKKAKDIPDVEVLIGRIPEEEKKEITLLVISPGVPVDSPLVEEFRQKGIPVWGEIELAYHFGKGSVIAITGNNGWTTTTTMVGENMSTD